MALAEAGCLFIGFILCLSGVQGQRNSICALKGSSVDLPCSGKYSTSSMKWYSVRGGGPTFVLERLAEDENHVIYYKLEESNVTLTIKDLGERDAMFYCCIQSANKSNECQQSIIQLRVTDLQVKVIPTMEGNTVTLMCSTSCALTETPAAYIWYKNGDFLYEDWSPWYQQLVSGDKAVTYSCAIKGFEDLKAPEVSVDSVTSTCFTVTYAKRGMCSYEQTSMNEPCTITYPRGIYVQKLPASAADHVRLTCNTNCTLTGPQTAYSMYRNYKLDLEFERAQSLVVPQTCPDSFSCAVKGLEEPRSATVCAVDGNCWRVNYVSRRICALKGSSVNISSEYSFPFTQKLKSSSWFKIYRTDHNCTEKLVEGADSVDFRIEKLKNDDSAEYIFKIQTTDEEEWRQPDFPGVTLVVTGLSLKFTPSAVVTEGQRVILTCSTSCPLPANTNYTWKFNSRPLALPEGQNKHLVLDPAGSQDAGRYSCAVKTGTKTIGASEKSLTVQNIKGKQTAAAAGVGAVLVFTILIIVLWWVRRKRASSRTPCTETSNNLEQLNPGPMYEEISGKPAEQDDLHYSQVHFHQNHRDPLYSTVHAHQPQDQKHVLYAVVNFKENEAT